MLNWANGIVFLVSPYPDSDIIMKRHWRGTIYFSSVVFAPMPKYESAIKLSVGVGEIPMIDQTSVSGMKQIAQ